MFRMLRIYICAAAVLLSESYVLRPILHAQEPSVISGDQAVRFEQSPGFFHYAALCRTAKEFMAQMPAPKLSPEVTESAVCWYVKGSRSGAPEADGKLVISAHHVRFMPHGPRAAALYADLGPEEVELKHDPGQPYATLQSKDLVFTFRFSKLCPECAPGTAVTSGFVPALLDQEFGLLEAGIRHFDSGWKQVYRLSSGDPAGLPSRNQPASSAASTASAPPPSLAPKGVIAPRPAVAAVANSSASKPARPDPAEPQAPVAAISKPAATSTANSTRIANTSRPGIASPFAAGAFSRTPAAPAAVNASAPPSIGSPRMKPVKIASRAADGLLLKKVPPAYPLEAKLVRLEGTVVLRAIIDKTGEVSEVYAVTGPPLLESAAVEAVKQWQYKPYSLNGQPVDVETTIQVVFALEGPQPATRAQSYRR